MMTNRQHRETLKEIDAVVRASRAERQEKARITRGPIAFTTPAESGGFTLVEQEQIRQAGHDPVLLTAVRDGSVKNYSDWLRLKTGLTQNRSDGRGGLTPRTPVNDEMKRLQGIVGEDDAFMIAIAAGRVPPDELAAARRGGAAAWARLRAKYAHAADVDPSLLGAA
jgi:hypothetical protein